MYRWGEHVGELELELEAPTEPALFRDAFAAFCELAGGDGETDGEQRTIELEGGDRGGLLADWLDELVYLADAEQFVPERLVELRLDDGRLRAVVRGHRGAPSCLVKAVTRHRLAFEPAPGGWWARVVLDV
ncbi:MAG TPA: archease [Gaiellaceae bacterium]|nr:archease [Gaiellaceae bacterium]